MNRYVRIQAIVVVVLILGGVAAYFVGRAAEHAGRERDAVAAAERQSALDAQLQAARGRSASLQSVNELLTAHLWVCRATVALDNRNFGVANDAVSKAVVSLGRVDARAAALDPQAFKAVQDQASSIRISVATNLASQRGQLLKLAEDIDAIVETAQTATGSAGAPGGG